MMKGVGQINPSCILTFARDNNSELIFKAVKDYGIPVDWANGVGCRMSTPSPAPLISTVPLCMPDQCDDCPIPTLAVVPPAWDPGAPVRCKRHLSQSQSM